jgi:hypothetical protein
MKQVLKFSTFDWILFGLVLHSLGESFFFSSKITCYVLCGSGLVIMFINLFRSNYQQPFEGFVNVMFYFYLFWSLFIVIRPFISDEQFSSDGYSLINRYTWLSLTPPFVVFLGFKTISLKSVFKFCVIESVIGILLIVLNYRQIFVVNHNFDLDIDGDVYQAYLLLIDLPIQFFSAATFIILCYAYVSSKQLLVGFATVFIALFTVLFTARRGNVFSYLLILLFTFIVYISSSSSRKSMVLKIVSGIGVILFGFVLFELFAGSAFSFFLTRLGEDTRSNIEVLFYQSFKNKPLDWAIGRGLNGSYTTSTVATSAYRRVIETGYLQLILNGGIVYLALFVGFLGHSAYLGWFRTKNVITKGMAMYLIAHIIYLEPYGLPAFSLEYILVWICVFYCQSEKFRMSSENLLKMYIKFT